MPNRILKDSICTSNDIDLLSDKAEILFYRLIVQCDDYGCFDGRNSVIRSRCFPLRIDTIKDKDIEKWLGELVNGGMIRFYTDSGNRYLTMTSWETHQQMRAKRRKYPEPPDITCNHLISDDIGCNQMIPARAESESESESESEIESESELRSATVPYEDIVSEWNSVVTSLPKVRETNPARKRGMDRLWQRCGDLERVADLFDRVQQSDFLTGRVGSWTGCGFDWVLKSDNLTKIIEGNYINKPNARQSPAERIMGYVAQQKEVAHDI